MPNSIHRLENFLGNKTTFAREGITTDEQKYAWFQKEYLTVDKTREELSAIFGQLFPGENLIIPEDQVSRRAAVSENARHEYILLGIEMNKIQITSKPPRHLGAFFRLETDEQSIAYNRRLDEAIGKKDYAEVCRACEEFLRDLPSYDMEELLNLPDEELPRVFRELYPAYSLAQEAEKILSKVSDPLTVYLRNHLSEDAKQMLAALQKDATVLSKLKVRCDTIADPHYAYIDTNKILGSTHYAAKLMTAQIPGNLSRTLSNLWMGITFSGNALGREVLHLLEKAGFPSEGVSVCNERNRELQSMMDYKTALMNGDVIFCTAGKKVKACSMEKGKLVEQDPVAALDRVAARADAAMKKAGDILNGRVADPIWMLTGSSQYRDMKRAYAGCQRLEKGGEGTAETEKQKALEKLEASALAYLRYKNVDLDRAASFEEFTRPGFGSNGNSLAEKLSKRELARIEAAYSLLEAAREKMGVLKLYGELRRMPAFAKQQMHNEAMFAEEEGKAAPTRAGLVNEMNQNIRQSPLLGETVAAVGEDNTAETLRQDVDDALFNSENGLMHKKVFTQQDRQRVEEVLAKAVVLDIIRIGRRMESNAAALTEEAYKTNSKSVLDQVKETKAFRQAVGKHISPDGVRRFFAGNRHSGVSKDFLSAAAAKKPEKKAEMQKDMQPEIQRSNEMKVEAAPKNPGVGLH